MTSAAISWGTSPGTGGHFSTKAGSSGRGQVPELVIVTSNTGLWAEIHRARLARETLRRISCGYSWVGSTLRKLKEAEGLQREVFQLRPRGCLIVRYYTKEKINALKRERKAPRLQEPTCQLERYVHVKYGVLKPQGEGEGQQLHTAGHGVNSQVSEARNGSVKCLLVGGAWLGGEQPRRKGCGRSERCARDACRRGH